MPSVRALLVTVLLSAWLLTLKAIGLLQYLLGTRFFTLDADSLVDEMQKKYGTTISLAQNPVWMNGLRLATSKANEECSQYQLYGKWRRKTFILGSILEPLLLTEAAVARHPDILDVPVCRPIFITGTGRNGSTLLHSLMCNYGNVKYLKMDECHHPIPYNKATEFDIKWYRERQSWWSDILFAGEELMLDLRLYSHPLSSSSPEECLLLLTKYLFWMPFLSFGGPYKAISWSLSQPTFALEAYRLFKRDLQVFLYYAHQLNGINVVNTRYVLKCPYHMPFHDVIRQVFPDAVIIRLHRDPVKVVPSYSSMVQGLIRTGYPMKNNSQKKIGEDVMKWVDMCCKQMVDEGRDNGMIDVRYDDLMEDPIGVCAHIADTVGLEHTSDVEGKLSAYLERNPKHKYGIHSYSPAQYGLDSIEIRKNLATYCEMFNV